jgi:hypothetical protein
MMSTSISLKGARTAGRILGIVRYIPKPSLKELVRILDRHMAGGARFLGVLKIQLRIRAASGNNIHIIKI